MTALAWALVLVACIAFDVDGIKQSIAIGMLMVCTMVGWAQNNG